MKIAILTLAVALGMFVGGIVGYSIKPDTAIVETDISYLDIEGQKVPVGPNDSVEYIIEEFDKTDAGENNYEGSASATGGSFSFLGYNGGIMGKSLMSQSSGPAEISVGGAMGTLPATAYSMALSVNNGPLVILVFGCICVIAGIVCWVYWNKKLGIWVTVAGGALIVVGLTFSSFPWIGLLLIPLVIAAVIYFWYRAKKGDDVGTTLKTIVKAVEGLDEEDKETVTIAVSEEAKASGQGTNGVKPVVSKVVAEVKKEVV